MTAVLEPVITPVVIGPTCARNPDWDGRSKATEFILPRWTLGWQIIKWVEENLLAEADEDDDEQPFKLTNEQKRLLLHWYAIDDRGVFVYRDGILQRLKGWGKDPFAAVLAAVEFVGPCRFKGWATEDMEEHGISRGEPYAVGHPRALVQVAAVSLVQTRQTLVIFKGLFSRACKAKHRIDLSGTFTVFAYKGMRSIQAITSNPRSLEGPRPTFVIRNEVSHWIEANKGHAMGEVISRNVAKGKDGASRALSITNAYNPAENSWAQVQREAWEAEAEGLSIDTGVFYDSLEVPSEVGFSPPRAKGDPDPTEGEIRAWVAAAITAVRGDSYWLPVERLANSTLSAETQSSVARRFYYNQIVTSEDAWVASEAVAAAEHYEMTQVRARAVDPLRIGWTIVEPTDKVVMFGDGSKSEDSTGLIGCRLSDGYCFTIGIWARPPALNPKIKWLVDREDVSKRVDEAFARFNIVAFWFDPSHARDDEENRYWDPYCDRWHRKHKPALEPKHWAVKTGDNQHSVIWDMTSIERNRQFTGSAETTALELERMDALDEKYMPAFFHDGHPALELHMRNARLSPNPHGTSVRKETRVSTRKIDLAVCLIGARLLRRVVLNIGVEDPADAGGWIWGV